MAIERSKEVTVNGRRFLVGLVTAAIGNWIVLQLASGKALDHEVYQRVQNYLFSEISVIREKDGIEVPMKVFADGNWLAPDLDLEYDLDTVHELYGAALDFNFSPFFAKRSPKPTSTT